MRVAGARRFLLLPAIDLLGGRVVRLRRGDASAPTAYPGTPGDVARRWGDEGADVLHVVDLGAALGSAGANAASVRQVLAAARGAGLPCEVAGGVRSAEAAGEWLAGGAGRVVLATALIAEPGLAAALVAAHGAERIVAAIDVRDGTAVGDGWRGDATGPRVDELVGRLLGAGVRILEVTAIARDGAMSGPDLGLLESVRRVASGATLIASGGIRGVDDLLALRDAGCDGAILGRALYEGALSLREAREALDVR